MKREAKPKLTVALAGNPNVGKSTLFNHLTGLHQHTGNWPGKTVELVRGRVKNTNMELVDLPGTYSLSGSSEDERVAAEFISGRESDCTVAVCDASSLQRSLILVLQILKRTEHVVVCVNLVDEARRNGLTVHKEKMQALLGVPVVLTSAGRGEGVEDLVKCIQQLAAQGLPKRVDWPDPIQAAQMIEQLCVSRDEATDRQFRRKIEALFVSRRFGVGFMLLLLTGILWITIWGANYPADALQYLFDRFYLVLKDWCAGLPYWLQGLLLEGMYSTAARVISVMLPPMAIFFPLFTVLEDVGYLPRMAFLLDPAMARCGGCGRQALTLCMGLGCNAVGVMGCRIMDSPGKRLAAMLTNAMVPCNGRFPTLILLGSLLFPGAGAALAVAACVALGVVGAMAVSGILNKGLFREEHQTFLMEMPPFRRPRLGKILVRSLIDRTAHIALRALYVAVPAGGVLWLLSEFGLLEVLCSALDPVGLALGMSGAILVAFAFCLPANELMIPVLLMTLTGAGTIRSASVADTQILFELLTVENALCMMVFTLFHWPCATTLMTFYRQTKSIKKTAAAFLLPTAVGVVLCLIMGLLL